MTKKIDRRGFIRQGAILGAASMFSGDMLARLSTGYPGSLQAAQKADMVVVNGKDYFKSTQKAVEQLGGMEAFVSRGSKVALLVNCPFKNHGASVNPDITLAVIKMCLEAGAKEISFIKEPFDGYWQRSKLSKQFEEEIKNLKPGWENKFKDEIKGAISLKDATIAKDLFDADVLINVSITKQHEGTGYSCILKNMMGSTSTQTNLYFHFGGKLGLGFFKDVGFLSQCIADLNLVRKPDLCIADTTEFLLTNGPYGPGKLGKLQKVIAGTDRLAVDTYCASLIGLEANKIQMINKAHEFGLGNPDVSKLNIQELTI